MTRFHHTKVPTGLLRMSRRQLLLFCVLLSLLIYFLRGRSPGSALAPLSHLLQVEKSSGDEEQQRLLLETSWSAPVVWGDSRAAVWRRGEFSQRTVSAGLLVLTVGGYGRFLRQFLSSAELHFLPGTPLTYYVLTDNPGLLQPPPPLSPERELRMVRVSEVPGWERLSRRRMALLAATIKEQIQQEVEYIFCMDVDQEFVGMVGKEILGDLVATLHPQFYNMRRQAYPYELDESSTAYVLGGEGDFYYTSELFGGLCSEVYTLALACSQFILQDLERGIQARHLEESYLNRYLINRRPTCVLSPEYSWWGSPPFPHVPTPRVISLGRQCDSMDPDKRELNKC